MVNNTQVLYQMGGFHLFECSSDETINDNQRISWIDDELGPVQLQIVASLFLDSTAKW